MHRRLIIALSLLVGLPLTGLVYLALKIAHDEREMAAMQWRALLEGRLRDLSNSIAAQTDAIERDALSSIDEASRDTDGLRALVRRSPLVAQAFLLRPEGRLEFPPDDQTTSEDERRFLDRTRSIWKREAILYAPPQAEQTVEGPFRAEQRESGPPLAGPGKRVAPPARRAYSDDSSGSRRRRPRRAEAGDSLLDLAEVRDSGWITWYWQEGLHLLLWQRLESSPRVQAPDGASGGVIGVEVDRVAALAQIIGRLPEPANLEGRIVLLNARGEPMAQWGPFQPPSGAPPSARVTLSPPWDAWRLVYYPSPARRAGFMAGSGWGLALGLGALILSLVGLAAYFYRESDREMREAAQRVTFVTQVSHELKTPLTNIRLYAELLDRDLEDDDDKPRHRVSIIVSEAQRLSRLINNILTFSRQRRGKLTVAPKPVRIDPLIEGMVAQFEPALASSGVEVEMTLDAPHATRADADTVDQILANLLSNVEKYAAQGRWVGVSTRQDDRYTYVVVSDRGPGISLEHRERVFQPFYRISDRLADGVTGTGIGLALSAELARKNSGALRLLPTDRGACFELVLPRA